MINRLGGLGTLALLFAAGCFVAALYQKSLFPALLGLPGAVFVVVRFFRTADA